MRQFSIIVPVYHKEQTQPTVEGIQNIYDTLCQLKSNYIKSWELIVVIDGRSESLFKQIKKINPRKIAIYQYPKHQGKGYALLHGFRKSSGAYITFIDCDGDINLKQIFNFLPYLATADIVVGSKRHPFSKINYPVQRKILSRGFQLLSFIILGSSLRDTQTGLKILKREVLDVIADSIKINHFTFDLELCFLAQKHGFRIVEAPIEINFQHNSSIRLDHMLKMLWDVLRIRFWFSFTKQYQKEFKKRHFK